MLCPFLIKKNHTFNPSCWDISALLGMFWHSKQRPFSSVPLVRFSLLCLIFSIVIMSKLICFQTPRWFTFFDSPVVLLCLHHASRSLWGSVGYSVFTKMSLQQHCCCSKILIPSLGWLTSPDVNVDDLFRNRLHFAVVCIVDTSLYCWWKRKMHQSTNGVCFRSVNCHELASLWIQARIPSTRIAEVYPSIL